MKYRVLINDAVLARDLTIGQANTVVNTNKNYINGQGKRSEHLKNAAYRIVEDVGDVPPSRFWTGDSNNQFIAARGGDLSSWCAALDRMPRGPFGPIVSR